MNNRVRVVLMLVIGVFIAAVSASGQEDFNSNMLKQMEKSQKEYAARTDDEKKLQYGAFELLREAEGADTSAEIRQRFRDRLKMDERLKADSKDRVLLVIESNSSSGVKEIVALVQSLDGVVESSSEYFRFVTCNIHPKKLRSLCHLPPVVRIYVPSGPHTRNIVSAMEWFIVQSAILSTRAERLPVAFYTNSARRYQFVFRSEV